MPVANMILSFWGIRSDQMNSQGNIAKKKSQMLDQTGETVSDVS